MKIRCSTAQIQSCFCLHLFFWKRHRSDCCFCGCLMASQFRNSQCFACPARVSETALSVIYSSISLQSASARLLSSQTVSCENETQTIQDSFSVGLNMQTFVTFYNCNKCISFASLTGHQNYFSSAKLPS